MAKLLEREMAMERERERYRESHVFTVDSSLKVGFHILSSICFVCVLPVYSLPLFGPRTWQLHCIAKKFTSSADYFECA